MILKSAKKLLDSLGKKLFSNLLMHGKFEKLPLTIHWRRIFILPTKPGLFFGLVCFLMLIASLNFNNNMGLMLTFLLVGMSQVALHRVFFNLRNLKIKDITSQPVFVGDFAEFHIHISADEDKYDLKFNQEDHQDMIFELKAEDSRHLVCLKPARKRGWMSIQRYKISTSYPFGLFVSWVWSCSDVKCLIYPKPETSPPPLPAHSHSEGETQVILQGDDFHGLKPYQPGDSMRLIAWKRTAQVDELISREYQQEHGHKLLLDFSQVNLLNLEDKLSRLTAWVIKAHQLNLEYCLILPDFNSGYGYSMQHHQDCLKALALY